MLRLARDYRDGIGTDVDLLISAECMRKVDAKNIRPACWELFDVLWRINTSETDSEMIALAQTQAKSGNAEMQGCLARAYRDGRGVDKNINLAAEWMRMANKNNIKWAGWELFDILWRIVTPETDLEMINLAQPWAEKGVREYGARMARAYRDGRGVLQDRIKVADLYRDASAKRVKWVATELEKMESS